MDSRAYELEPTYHPVKFHNILSIAVKQGHVALHSLAQRVYVLPGLPQEKRGFSCIPFKVIAQNPAIENLPHCVDFTDNPSHQLETKPDRGRYCNKGGDTAKRKV